MIYPIHESYFMVYATSNWTIWNSRFIEGESELRSFPRGALVRVEKMEKRERPMTTGFNEIELEENGFLIVTLVFKGKLEKEDYELFVPQIEGLMKEKKAIRILVELKDFHGWTVGALWEDTKFGAKHFNDIDRLAVVGDRKWEKTMTAFMKPFTAANVRYFDAMEKADAMAWLKEGSGEEKGK